MSLCLKHINQHVRQWFPVNSHGHNTMMSVIQVLLWIRVTLTWIAGLSNYDTVILAYH